MHIAAMCNGKDDHNKDDYNNKTKLKTNLGGAEAEDPPPPNITQT